MIAAPMSGTTTVTVRWDYAIPTQGAYLYRLYDADGALMYVGVTEALRTRLRTHARTLRPATASYERFVDRASAERAEVAAILAEAPALNVVVGNGQYGGGGR